MLIGRYPRSVTFDNEGFDVHSVTAPSHSFELAHNHPSGIAEPSREDIKTTQQLIAAVFCWVFR